MVVKQEDLEQIDPRWRGEFFQFLVNGNASPEFREYLNDNPDANKVVDKALKKMLHVMMEKEHQTGIGIPNKVALLVVLVQVLFLAYFLWL